MLSKLARFLLVAGTVAALSAGAASLDSKGPRLLSGDDFGESGDVDDHEESAVPLWMAGFTATNNIEASDTWLALRSQATLQWDEPITNVVWLGSHNAFNSLGGVFPFSNDGVATVLGTSPNQSVSIVGQLNLGARLIELDLWAGGDGTDLFLRHGDWDLTSDIEINFNSALRGMAEWLAEPENANEIVFVDFEDAVEQQDIKPGEAGARSTLLAAMDTWFGGLMYTPEDRIADGAWPSRRELVAAGKRVIVFTHRNDANGSVFGTHTNSGQGWWYAGPAFLADGSNLDGLGNFEQVGLGNLRGTAIEPEDESVFSAMQSDGIDITGAPAAKTLDMIYTASRNLNFAKVDFIFGYQNDVDNEFDTPDEDDPLQEKGPYDTHPHRGNRLKGLVWSWAEGDPAVQRQWFRAAIPAVEGGASSASGTALRAFFEDYFEASATGGNDKAERDLEVALEQRFGGDRSASDWPMLVDDMATRGANARANGRDYAVQEIFGTNWVSAFGTTGAFPWALRSTTRDPATGRYRWKITSETGTWEEWRGIDLDAYTDADGTTYAFAAPVNGFQNGSFDPRMLNEDVIDEDDVFIDLVVPYADLATRPAHSLWEARIEAAFRAEYETTGNFVLAFLAAWVSADTPVWINVQDVDRDGHWVANDEPNAAPSAAGDAWSTDEDVPLAIPAPGVLGNDDDPDGDLLTAVLVSEPEHGTLAFPGDGSFTYTPDANFFGADSFRYRVTDGEADSGVATVSLTVNSVNDPPVANADAYALDEDSTLEVVAALGVLANDSDVEGPLLAELETGPVHGSLQFNSDGSFSYEPNANYFGPDAFTYRASDGEANSVDATVSLTVNPVNDPPVANADAYALDEDSTLEVVAALGVLANDSDVEGPLLAELETGPVHGSLRFNADGSFSYEPNANYFGADAFTYRASDGEARSEPVTVALEVRNVNDAPVAVDDAYVTDEDVPLTVREPGVITNDFDLDGDPLAASVVTGPSHGHLALSLNGLFIYTPDANFNGTDSFTYRLTDPFSESEPATVTITVNPVNDAPVAVDDAWATDEDTPLTVSAPGVLGNDFDVDGDALAAVLVTGPSAGSLSWGGDGSFIYMPDPNFFGVDAFTYRANDGALASNEVTVTLTINAVNDAPVAVDDAYTTNEDTPLTVTAPGVLGNDTDVEGDPLTALVVAGPANGTVVLGADGALQYTPDPDFDGTDSFTYVANDGALDSVAATVTLRVVSAEDQVDALLEAVGALFDDGLLGRGRVNSFETKLEQVLASLGRDNARSAGNQLSAFINAVEDAIASGDLPEAEGLALIELAEAALVSIRGGG